MSIIVLFGGSSNERHVSVASAQSIARALGTPLCWFWAPHGAVHDVSVHELIAHQRPFEIDFDPKRPAIFPDLEQALDTLPVDDPVFMLALHGGAGEDGTVQRMMESRGIPFTGSDSNASAAAFDKGRAKQLLGSKVRMAESRIVSESDEETIRTAAESMLGKYPKIVLKPLAAGSSRGLFFLERGGDIDGVIRSVVELRMPYIIEQFISGRELTCGIAEVDGRATALPVIEIVTESGQTFDYEGKYLGKGTKELCPAPIPDAMRDDAQQVALAAHAALGCEGYSRSDLIGAEDGVYFLEINTLPGLTVTSLVPLELNVAGIDFRTFLETQIDIARRRVSVPQTTGAGSAR
jgi:D-alanine-D-alanine ligase